MNFPNPYPYPLDFPVASDIYPATCDDPDNTLAIDWETYYDKEYSLKNMSAIAYVMDEQFDPYLVAIYGKVRGQDIHACGRPGTIPWDEIISLHAEKPIRFLAHNASFDEIVTWRYLSAIHPQQFGLTKLVSGFQFMCTADLAAYLKYPRALAGLSYQLKLPALDKSVRDAMKGVDFQDDANLTNEVLNYAMQDAKNCYAAWNRLSSLWPEHERKFSVASRRRAYRGVPMDVQALEKGIKILEGVKEEAEKHIPWPWEERGNLTPLSSTAMKNQCVKDEIPVPASFAQDKSAEWEEEYAQDLPWVAAIRDWRKANTHGSRLKRMLANSNPETQFMHFQQLYCGAHTGRSSGTGGINMQNIPSGEVVGDINIRNMIRAPKDHILMIADYDQIEPRLLYHQTGMKKVLDLIRGGMHPYEAHARATMGYTHQDPLKTQDPHMYKVAKFRVIGLGYGCGWRKFKELCKTMGGFIITEEEAQSIVYNFRDTNEPIVNYWYDHDQWLNISAKNRDKTYCFKLLSGRMFEVFDPQYVFDPETELTELKARNTRGDNLRKTWGGTLTENEIQGTGMDIMKSAVEALNESELNKWLLDTHDELVFLLPKSDYLDIGREIIKKMTNIPWLPSDFPLGASADYEDMYMKG